MKIAPPPPKSDQLAKALPQPAKQAPLVEPTPNFSGTKTILPPRSPTKSPPRGPRKAEKEKRTHQIAVHCTQVEEEKILEAARKAGRKPGRYIVYCALKTRDEISRDSQLYDEIIRKRGVKAGTTHSHQPTAA
jgi:hypothetical protein